MSHIIVGRHYPSFLIQVIVGCFIYVLSFLVIMGNNYDLKYHILSLVAIDITLIIYRKSIKKNIDIDTSTKNAFTDINDFKILSDFSAVKYDSNSYNNHNCNYNIKNCSMFLTSDENSIE